MLYSFNKNKNKKYMTQSFVTKSSWLSGKKTLTGASAMGSNNIGYLAAF